MTATSFVREFREQFAVARHVTRATFLACYTGFASAYVGWSVLSSLTDIDTTALVLIGAMFGYGSYAVFWCLARMAEASSQHVHPEQKGDTLVTYETDSAQQVAEQPCQQAIAA